MTTLWRCSKRSRLASAFTGEGGRHYDGRWHTAGHQIIYTSDSASLALLETLVHGWSLEQALKFHALISCTFPDEHIHTVGLQSLPEGWDDVQPTASTQGWGDEWLETAKWPAVRVPSAVVPGTNVLLNPHHPIVKRHLVPAREQVEWDPRLVRVAVDQ